MRKKIIAGNWKMNYSISQAVEFVENIKEIINTKEVDVVLCPSFVCLETVSNLIEGTHISLGAQNVYFENSGAYTGEISCQMLLSAGVKYCIIGHSERRQYFDETDEDVNKKLKMLLENDIIPIVCVGETLEKREENKMYEVIEAQILKALQDISENDVKEKIVIAYEPIWAIGTGVTASKEQAEDMCKFIRDSIAKKYGEKVAKEVRIQYGGSVKPNNANEILNMENIDGALVGGAALTNDFVAIVNY